MKNAIKIKDVSKKFRIPHESRSTLAESVIGAITKGRVKYEDFYALKDVNLNVSAGEFVGIIGPNGSGKTTLLKIIGKILEPDKGSVSSNGRIIPLLEMGIGFMQELTAKENIYLYGSLLGLSRNEVNSKLKAIVDFAGIRQFTDTPLKDFSTGMMARLAFSIAKEVEGDIYLIDEVMAVGDAEFQEKCKLVFKELKSQGKTLLFVSHNLSLVCEVCDRAVFLYEGRIRKTGSPDKVCEFYDRTKQKRHPPAIVNELKAIIKQNDEMISALENKLVRRSELENKQKRTNDFFMAKKRWGSGEVKIGRVILIGKDEKEKKVLMTGDSLRIRICYDAKKNIPVPEIGFAIYDESGTLISGPNNYHSGQSRPIKKGIGYIDYVIDRLALLDGKYNIHVAISKAPASKKNNYDYIVCAAKFEIRNRSFPEKYGLVTLNGKWELEDYHKEVHK
ncbi:MAG: ABC transporter ATP-binding protein [archaeon]